MSAIEAEVPLGGAEPLRVGLLLHPKRLRLDQEMRGLAEMGVGRDSHGTSGGAAGAEDERLSVLMDVDLPLVVRLGEAELRLEELLALRPGSVIELNKMVDEPAELIVNNKVLAYGEIVVVHEKFGIRIERLAGEAAGILA
jgi:flagellar motor switch protein FliN